MTKKIPRGYQQDAYDALIKSALTPRPGTANGFEIPFASIFTGLGKSLVSAMLTNKVLNQGGRVLQLVPSKELCEQNYEEAWHYVDRPDLLGICCAKLHRAQVERKAVIATYTSFLRRRAHSGAFNLLIVDEVHYVAPSPESSYQQIIRSLLRLNPSMKIIGLSSTPYRMGQGYLYNDCADGKALFTCCAYETDTKLSTMIQKGYLSHVESISGDVEADMNSVKLTSLGDYNTDQMGVKFDAIVKDAVADMRVKFAVHKIQTALIFASNLANAFKILSEWDSEWDSDEIRIIYGDMPDNDRRAAIDWIKNGAGKRYIVNVGVLTTGFDHTSLDCVVLMRATMSLGLYVQMVGRVVRPHDDKERGYVIDYGSNIERHGPIDATLPPKPKKRRGDAPKKLCTLILDTNIEYEGVQYKRGQECNYANILAAKYCRKCGGEFISENEDGKYSMRSRAQILAAKIEASTVRHDVEGVVYVRAYSRKDSIPMIKMLIYGEDAELIHTHYIFLDHPGGMAAKARNFVMELFNDYKDYYELGQAGVTVDNMCHLLNNAEQYFKKIVAVTVRPGANSKFKELVEVEFE